MWEADFWVRDQPDLQSKFQNSQGYNEKSYVKQTNNNSNNMNETWAFKYASHHIVFTLYLCKVLWIDISYENSYREFEVILHDTIHLDWERKIKDWT